MTDCELQTDVSFGAVLASGDLLRAKRYLFSFTRDIENIEKWSKQEWNENFHDLKSVDFPHITPFIKEKNAFGVICLFQQDLYLWLSAVVAIGQSLGHITNVVAKSQNILQWGEHDERWEHLKESLPVRFSPIIQQGKFRTNVVLVFTFIEIMVFDMWKEIVGNVKNKKAFGGALEDLGDESESEEEDSRHSFHDIGCDGNHEVYNC
jgi:hypothetical protein